MKEKNKVLLALAFLFAVGFLICMSLSVRADVIVQERTVIGRLFQNWKISGDNEVTQDITFYTGLSPTDYQAVYGGERMDANFWIYAWRKSLACLNGDRKECMYHIENAMPYQIGFILTVIEPVINELQKQILWNKVENEVNTEYLKHQTYYKNKCEDYCDKSSWAINELGQKFISSNKYQNCLDECGYCQARFFIYQQEMTKYKWNWDNFMYTNGGNSCYQFKDILKS